MEDTLAVAVAGVAVLAPAVPVRLETVGIGIDVDEAREPGVRDRAVVALEVVLDGDLPVRGQGVVGALVEAELRRVEWKLQVDRERLLQVARPGVESKGLWLLRRTV